MKTTVKERTLYANNHRYFVGHLFHDLCFTGELLKLTVKKIAFFYSV